MQQAKITQFFKLKPKEAMVRWQDDPAAMEAAQNISSILRKHEALKERSSALEQSMVNVEQWMDQMEQHQQEDYANSLPEQQVVAAPPRLTADMLHDILHEACTEMTEEFSQCLDLIELRLAEKRGQIGVETEEEHMPPPPQDEPLEQMDVVNNWEKMTIRIAESGWTSYEEQQHNRNLINVVQNGKIVGQNVHLLVTIPEGYELNGRVLYVDLKLEQEFQKQGVSTQTDEVEPEEGYVCHSPDWEAKCEHGVLLYTCQMCQ